MIPLPWLIAGALALAAASGFAGYRTGSDLKQGEWDAAELKRADKTIVRIQKEVEIRDRVVTKWREREKVIEVKSEEVKREIPVYVRADCIVPADLLLQLHAISRGVRVPDSGATESQAAGAPCRSLAEAIEDAYVAHRLVIAQLNSILDWDEARAR